MAKDDWVHPIWKALAKYGNTKMIAEQINTEFKQPDVKKVGPALLSHSWMLMQWMLEARPIPLAAPVTTATRDCNSSKEYLRMIAVLSPRRPGHAVAGKEGRYRSVENLCMSYKKLSPL